MKRQSETEELLDIQLLLRMVKKTYDVDVYHTLLLEIQDRIESLLNGE